MRARLALVVMLIACLGLQMSAQEAGTRINIINKDGAGEGFNDPAAATPVGGNTGTTLGEQRLIAFQYAADLWAALLDSPVEIRVEANFDPLECTNDSAVLGSAGATTVFANFDNAPIDDMWYVGALANKLAGRDLNDGNGVIRARFNSALNGSPTCLSGQTWYYGLDNNPGPNQTDLVVVVLHELAHGLGFVTLTDKSTGAFLNNRPDIYSNFLFDNTVGATWPQMSSQQRKASVTNTDNLVWIGQNAVAAAPSFLDPAPMLVIEAPASIAGELEITVANFSGPITVAGVNGVVVAALDAENSAGPSSTDGCTALTNAAEVAGRIALIDRGNCTFVTKAQNARDAGARAVIIANNVSGPPQGMAGTDSTITIPVIGISQADGAALRGALAAGVTATIRGDAQKLAGTDALGRPLMYAPPTLEAGSSVSHWDTSAQPDLLMEPNISNSLGHGVDLSRDLFADLGWFSDAEIEATLRDLLYLDLDRDGKADPGDTVRLIASIQNNGEVSGQDLIFDMEVPAGLIVTAVETSGTITSQSGRVTIELDSLAVGAQTLVTIDLQISPTLPPSTTSVSVQGAISGSNVDTSLTDDPATVETDDATVIDIDHSPLRAYKSVRIAEDVDLDGGLSGGDVIRYEITIRNGGASALQNVRLTDVLDTNITIVPGSLVAPVGAVVVSGTSSAHGSVEVVFGTLAAGASVTVSFDAIVDLSIDDSVRGISNQATVSSDSVSSVLTDDPGTQALLDPTVIYFPDERRRPVRRR